MTSATGKQALQFFLDMIPQNLLIQHSRSIKECQLVDKTLLLHKIFSGSGLYMRMNPQKFENFRIVEKYKQISSIFLLVSNVRVR